jgi:hypothetical protein
MDMKIPILAILMAMFITGISSSTCTAQNDDLITRLKSQLFFYRTQNAIQTVDVQTDKTLYRQGETIWFKGYVLDELTGNLSLNSLSLNVILTDDGGNFVAEGVFPLENGRTNGTLEIPVDLPNGVYRLVAYTQEMTNGSPQNVFSNPIYICRPENLEAIGGIEFREKSLNPACKEVAYLKLTDLHGKPASGKKFEYSVTAGSKEIVSGKGKTNQEGRGEVVFLTPSNEVKDPVILSVDIQSGGNGIVLKKKIPVVTEKINIRFFPEGGKLVSGIPQLIVFEALDQLDNPVSLFADIVGEDGSVVAKAKTLQPGLGVFHLLNAANQILKFRIESEFGKGQETILPLPDKNAMTIAVKKNDGVNLSVMLAPSPDATNYDYAIVAICAGEIVWASEFELSKAGMINIPLDNFRHDISGLAIFDLNGNLVGERIVFTGKEKLPEIIVQTDKSSYQTEGYGDLKIKIVGSDGKPVRAELTVSLSDTTTLPDVGKLDTDIRYGLGTSVPKELIGKESDKLLLDYYLIANKIKGLDWKKIVMVDPEKPVPFNQNIKRISGTVTGTDGKPIPNAMVSLTSVSLQQYNGRSNEKGEFEINIPARLDKKNLEASATDSNGKGNYKVILSNSFKEEVEIYLKNHPKLDEWEFLTRMKPYFDANPNFEKANPPSRVKAASKSPGSSMRSYLDDATNMIDVIKKMRSFELINGKIVFRGANSITSQDGALIVLDGQKLGTEASILNGISPKEVADVRILLDPVEMSRYTSLNSVGIIEITLKRGSDMDAVVAAENPEKANFNPEFVPTPIGNEKFKLITTLVWSPMVFTDEKGEAALGFKTGKIKSAFRLNIKGFTDQGEWVGTEKDIEVK